MDGTGAVLLREPCLYGVLVVPVPSSRYRTRAVAAREAARVPVPGVPVDADVSELPTYRDVNTGHGARFTAIIAVLSTGDVSLFVGQAYETHAADVAQSETPPRSASWHVTAIGTACGWMVCVDAFAGPDSSRLARSNGTSVSDVPSASSPSERGACAMALGDCTHHTLPF